LVCVLTARGKVWPESLTRKQKKEKQHCASYECSLGRKKDILLISQISCLSVCLVVGSLKVLSDLDRNLDGRIYIFLQLLNKKMLLYSHTWDINGRSDKSYKVRNLVVHRI